METLKNQRGFSMIETMIAIAVSLIGVAAVTTMIINSQKSVKTTKKMRC